jgi:hypothetical protein
MVTPPMPITSADEDDDTADDAPESGLDAAGLPWDERIHSSSRKIGKDGTWNKRRGGPSGTELAAIEAELRGGTVMPVSPVAAPVPPMPVPLPVPMTPQMAAAQQVAPVPPMPVAQPIAPVAAPAPMPPMPEPEPQPVAVEQTEWDFTSFMMAFGQRVAQIDSDYLVQVNALYGLNAITDLSVKPELIPTIVAQFKADGRW